MNKKKLAVAICLIAPLLATVTGSIVFTYGWIAPVLIISAVLLVGMFACGMNLLEQSVKEWGSNDHRD